jgi:TatD DNase family protein
MIDTHSHLYADEFKEDLQEVIQKSRDAGIDKIVLPAIDSNSHEQMMDLANAYPDYCLPMMGLHPCYVNNQDYEKELSLVRRLAW